MELLVGVAVNVGVVVRLGLLDGLLNAMAPIKGDSENKYDYKRYNHTVSIFIG